MRRSLHPSIMLWLALVALVALVASACSSGRAFPRVIGSPADSPTAPTGTGIVTSTAVAGMPPVLDPRDIYAADRPNALSPVVKTFPSLVYVPNSDSNSVD